MKRFEASIFAIATAALAAACSDATGVTDGPTPLKDVDGVLVLTQQESPDAVMNALHIGPVAADAAGCLRLVSETPADRSTVVWPRGFDLAADAGSLWVTDPAGAFLGEVGEDDFRLGGGHVPGLIEAVGFSPTERDYIEDRCPGNFWIAAPGEVGAAAAGTAGR